MCLHFLDLLQHEHFRRELTSTQCAKFIDDQILLHWQHYARKRTRMFQSVQQPRQQAPSQNAPQSTASLTSASNQGQNAQSNSNNLINGHVNLK